MPTESDLPKPCAEPLPPNPDALLNVEITPELIEKHGLLPEEYQRIVETLGRTPTLTELGIFGVMWSEHCSYKNSKPLLRKFPTQKRDSSQGGHVLVKAGEENAGVIDIGDGWGICFKIESHNHPSAVEPFEGAATGVGGIIRDIFTMGSRPVALSNSLRFGDPKSPTTQRLLKGVVHGIAHYGNCIGIPNIAGDVTFDPCYEGNPLVNALCLGVLRHEEIKRGAASGVGNPVYYVGAATGRDGLGGASFASRELTEESAADRPAVQKGDPFMEKLLMEACLEMMAVPGLVVGIQDMGAAGLTCSSCETAARGGTGVQVELDCVPQRETGMNSYEIMLSESQERMLVIVQKGREAEIEGIFEKWDLHAAKVGEVVEGTDMIITQGGQRVAHIPAAALVDEGPVYQREATEPGYLQSTRAWTADSVGLADLSLESPGGINAALQTLLQHPTVASKRFITQQYDHRVGASTVLAPGEADAGVIRLRTEAGDKFVALANDCNNTYCYLNPRRGAQIAIAECVRNLACTGARALGMTDNLNFGNPYKPEVFWTMKEAVEGLAEACEHFDVPCVGGNVSLYNENPKTAIDPTPVVSLAGLIDAPEHITKAQAGPGQTLWLLGPGGAHLLGTVEEEAAPVPPAPRALPESISSILDASGPALPFEIGGSQYLQQLHGIKAGEAPALDLAHESRLVEALLSGIRSGVVRAAHDLSEGGLLVCLAEMLRREPDEAVSIDAAKIPEASLRLTSRTLAVDLHLPKTSPGRTDAALFGESQGFAIVAI